MGHLTASLSARSTQHVVTAKMSPDFATCNLGYKITHTHREPLIYLDVIVFYGVRCKDPVLFLNMMYLFY